MWHFIETQFWANYCELSYFKQINLKSVYINTPKCYTLTVHESHMLLQIPSYLTQFLTQNHQNSTRKSLHVSDKMVYSQICHKYIHIMGGKDQTSKEIATCLNFVSPRICCEKEAAGMLRAFPVHFVPFQSNSRQCNMHGSCAATEICMKCGISLKHSFGQILWIAIFQADQPEICLHAPKCCMLTVYGSHTLHQIHSYLTQFLTQNAAR